MYALAITHCELLHDAIIQLFIGSICILWNANSAHALPKGLLSVLSGSLYVRCCIAVAGRISGMFDSRLS